MNEITTKEKIKIENLIYEIRGKQVILDSDLARLYQVETKRINEAVRNNPLKFPERFCWRLSDSESKNFLVENFDQKTIETRGGKYKNARVFTEQGVAMLSTVLKSKAAVEVSINIMDAFVAMRHFIMDNKNILQSIVDIRSDVSNINNKLLEHDDKLDVLFKKDVIKSNYIFYEGQIYDAYSLMMKILSKAKKEIIIIDNYAGRELFDLIKDVKVKVVIYTKNIDSEAIKKYKKQYNNIEIITNNSFHDRFIILDKKGLYHCGASFKNLGTKCFSINKIENKELLDNLLNYIN